MSYKILYVWKSEYPWDVRTEKFALSLVENGFDVVILSRWKKGQKKEEFLDGYKIIRVGERKPRKLTLPVSPNPIWRKEIRRAIENEKPDLIIVREIMLAEAAAKLARKYRLPIVMDMAENYPAAMKEWKKYNSSLFSRFLVRELKLPEIVEKRSVPLMDGVIVVCDEQIERLAATYGYPRDKTTVVHNVPLKKLFENAKAKKPSSPLVFGHHGYATAEKSLVNFLKAFLEASKANQKIKFAIAGEGDSIPELKRIAAGSPNVVFLGSYGKNDLPKILESFDVGVIPYQINDFNNYTVHNKLFDYFAAGLPVLVSRNRPLFRIIEETEAGIAVDCENPNEIAKKILEFESLDLEKMSAKARKAFLEKYNWELESKKLIKFVKQYLV